jgi:hypothetical protein
MRRNVRIDIVELDGRDQREHERAALIGPSRVNGRLGTKQRRTSPLEEALSRSHSLYT